MPDNKHRCQGGTKKPVPIHEGMWGLCILILMRAVVTVSFFPVSMSPLHTTSTGMEN